MDNPFVADIYRIHEASKKGKLVIFVGAGVSRNSNVLDWPGLIKKLEKELPLEVTGDNDFLKLAQLYKDERGTNEYLKKIRSELQHGKITYNGINEAIFDLDPIHVITTNYDNLLEQVLDSKNLQYYKVCHDKNLPYSDYNRYLIKMHGDLDEGNIVLTEDDYINYDSKFPLTGAFIKSLFASKTILFVGFSFNDYNLKIILSKVKSLLGEDFQMMYLLQTDSSHYIQKEYLKKRGIKVVEYNEHIKSNTSKVLKGLEKVSLEILKNDKGQKLYLLLKYIQKFEEIKLKSANPEELVKYIYEQINKHSAELNNVGGAKVADFLKSNNISATYDDYTLTVDFESLRILESYLQSSISNKRIFIKSSIYQLRVIQHFLVTNQIRFITKSFNSDLIDIPYRRFIKSEDSKARGISLLYEMNLKNLLEYIGKLRRSDTSNVTIDDLELPYLLYKLGRYYEAFIIYNDISSKCWQMKKYILFFICQYNIKYLLNPLRDFLHSDNRHHTIGELELIKDKIDKIDLDKLINYLSIDNKVVVKILRELIDFGHVHHNVYSLNDLVTKVKEAKTNAENGGFNSKNFAISILNSSMHLWNFCNFNFLISDYYKDHQSIYLRGFEGLVVSNNINKGQEKQPFFGITPSLKEIRKSHLQLVLFIDDYKELIKVFSSNKIDEITIGEQAKSYLFDCINNLKKPDKWFYEDHEYLKKFIKRFISNLAVLVTKLDSQDELNNEVIILLKKLSDVEQNILNKLVEPLTYFINNSKSLRAENLEEFLETIFRTQIIGFQITNLIDSLITRIIRLKGNPKNYKIPFDNDLVLDKIKNSLADPFAFSQVAYLYELLGSKQQEYIRENFKSLMDSNSSSSNFIQNFSIGFTYKIHSDGESELKFARLQEEYFKSNRKVSNEKYNISILADIYKSTSNQEAKKVIKRVSKSLPLLSFLIEPLKFSDFRLFEISWFHSFTIEEFKESFSNNIEFKNRFHELIRLNPEDKGLVKIYTSIY